MNSLNSYFFLIKVFMNHFQVHIINIYNENIFFKLLLHSVFN